MSRARSASHVRDRRVKREQVHLRHEVPGSRLRGTRRACVQPRDSSARGLRVEFPDDEWATLELAAEFARELDVPAIFAATGSSSFGLRIKWDAKEGWSCAGSVLEWEGAAAALHKMRPFVLQSESTEFG